MKARVVNVRTHKYDVYIGRNPRYGNTKWGNPFSHMQGRITNAQYPAESREHAIALYEAWLITQRQLIDALPELWGKVLGCHCAPLPCHGDVLLRRGNEPTSNPLIEDRLWVTGRTPSGSTFTCLVCIDARSRIVYTADMLKVFVGQDIENLMKWGKCNAEFIRGK